MTASATISANRAARKRGMNRSRRLAIGRTAYAMTSPAMNGASAGHDPTARATDRAMTPTASTPRPIASGVIVDRRSRSSAQRVRA